MGFLSHARQHDWDMLVQSIALASSEHQYLRISLRWYEHRPRVPCGPLLSLEARLRRMDVYHIEIQKNKEPHVPPGEATPYAIMTPQVWFPPSIMVVQLDLHCTARHSALHVTIFSLCPGQGSLLGQCHRSQRRTHLFLPQLAEDGRAGCLVSAV
jgi:hypothetical protein